MNEYDFNKKEEWEYPHKISGMEPWLVILPEDQEKYLKAAYLTGMKIDFTKMEDGRIQIWSVVDQDMKEFLTKLD